MREKKSRLFLFFILFFLEFFSVKNNIQVYADTKLPVYQDVCEGVFPDNNALKASNSFSCIQNGGVWSVLSNNCVDGFVPDTATCTGTTLTGYPTDATVGLACLACISNVSSQNPLKQGADCGGSLGTNCELGTVCHTTQDNKKSLCLYPIHSRGFNLSCVMGEIECGSTISGQQYQCTGSIPPIIGRCTLKAATCTVNSDCANQYGFSSKAICNTSKMCEEPAPPPDTKAKTSPWELCNQIKQEDLAYNACTECSGTSVDQKEGIYTAIGCIPANPKSIVQTVLQIGLSLAGGVALLMIIASGFIITISSGDQNQMKIAREMLTGAVVGLIFIIMSVTILQFIGLTILHIPGFGG